MGWQENDDDDDDNEEFNDNDIIVIKEFDLFVEQTYVFSILNLRAAFEPEVQNEQDPEKKSKIKEAYLDSMSPDDIDPDEIEELDRLYPKEKAKELINEKVINDNGEILIKVIDLSYAVEQISKNMVFALFGEMQKRGDVELLWDSKKEDFVYGLKQHKVKDETAMVAKMTKDRNKKRKKKK